MERSAR